MRYKILKRILRGQRTIGYQLLCESGGTVNISKERTLEAAKKGLIVNATYNRRTNSLSGTWDTDLRSLPIIQATNYSQSEQPRVLHPNKSNHELARAYISKQKILGVAPIKVEYLDNDRVMLIQVPRDTYKETFVVPSFITDFFINNDPIWNNSNKEVFCQCEINKIDFSKMDTSKLKNITSLFRGIDSAELRITGLNTKNVVYMSKLFGACLRIEHLDLRGLDTHNVEFMSDMFNGCWFLNNLDLSMLDTSSVLTTASMFEDCRSLKSLNLKGFSAPNNTTTLSMFSRCKALSSLDISSMQTSHVKVMSSMFNECVRLKSLTLGDLDTGNVKYMKDMFRWCLNLKALNLSRWDTRNLVSASGMFHSCSCLEYLNLSSWNTEKLSDMEDMFNGCESLIYLDLSSFNTAKVTGMRHLFSGCTSLACLDLSNFSFDSSPYTYGIFEKCERLKVVACNSEIARNWLKHEYLKSFPTGDAIFCTKEEAESMPVWESAKRAAEAASTF